MFRIWANCIPEGIILVAFNGLIGPGSGNLFHSYVPKFKTLRYVPRLKNLKINLSKKLVSYTISLQNILY